MKTLTISPVVLTTLRHLLMLVLLGGASVAIVPAYDALANSSASLPLPWQQALEFVLPFAYAAAIKLKNEVDAELQAEENQQLVAKNASLATLVNRQAKELEVPEVLGQVAPVTPPVDKKSTKKTPPPTA
jgi:cobalamin biosynthesis protein CobD/CbiB